MQDDQQKEFFNQAYRTGSDLWTHVPYHDEAMRILPQMERDSFVLDLGSGRGVWAFRLADMGYKVLGVDYVKHIVDVDNAEVKERGLAKRVRFIEGNVLDIPFADNSFDAVTDIGVLQHLQVTEWEQYMKEVKRVVKPGGYVLNVSLSKETNRFMGWDPKTADTGEFEKFGVSYYFFRQDQITQLMQDAGLQIVEQNVRFFEARSDPGDTLGFVFTLAKA